MWKLPSHNQGMAMVVSLQQASCSSSAQMSSLAHIYENLKHLSKGREQRRGLG